MNSRPFVPNLDAFIYWATDRTMEFGILHICTWFSFFLLLFYFSVIILTERTWEETWYRETSAEWTRCGIGNDIFSIREASILYFERFDWNHTTTCSELLRKLILILKLSNPQNDISNSRSNNEFKCCLVSSQIFDSGRMKIKNYIWSFMNVQITVSLWSVKIYICVQ